MRRTILAILAMLGLIIGGAQMASAHNYFDADGDSGSNYYPHWNYAQPVITVSDRSGYDLNEYEAAYSWGSYSADSVSLAYTTAQTCTWCIRIVNVPQSDLANPNAIAETYIYKESDNIGRVVTTQCTIKVSNNIANLPSATFRQGVVAHELGHCLGFEHPASGTSKSYSLMSTADAGYPPSVYTPRTADYAEMDYHYSY